MKSMQTQDIKYNKLEAYYVLYSFLEGSVQKWTSTSFLNEKTDTGTQSLQRVRKIMVLKACNTYDIM